MHVTPRVWTREERILWQRIAAHPFEDPSVDLDFARRLARTLGWSIEEARAAIEEYRRFCFLAAVTTGPPVTPSEEVDEVWHLHLTYTRDYWERWCGTVLGRRLDHDPTAGGPAEQARYRAQYAETLALYEAYFGPPPVAYWPGTRQRFADKPRFRLADRQRVWVVPRPAIRRWSVPGLAGLLTLVGLPRAAAAEALNPLDLEGGDFLLLFVCLLAIALVSTMILSQLVRTTRRQADLQNLSAVAMGYVNGGMARAADTLFLALAHHGAAKVGADIEIDKHTGPLPNELEAFRRALPASQSRQKMIARFTASNPVAAMLADLERRNLLLSATRRRLLQLARLAPVGLVLGLGLAKVVVGLGRHRPVGFLFFLCIVVGIGMVVAWFGRSEITQEAKVALKGLRTRLDRAVRAPRNEDLALAFAFAGATALVGTSYAAYARVMTPQSSGGSDGGAGCSSGSSGCGGGGGGCGGCSS